MYLSFSTVLNLKPNLNFGFEHFMLMFCFQMVVTGLPERSKNSDSTGSSAEVQKDVTLEATTSQIKSMGFMLLLLSLLSNFVELSIQKITCMI